jgi:predicted DNA binding CopG/RHH family protein
VRENRDTVVTVRFTTKEAVALRKTADRQGLSVSAYIRKRVKRRVWA